MHTQEQTNDNQDIYYKNLLALQPYISPTYYRHLYEKQETAIKIIHKDEGINLLVHGLPIYHTTAQNFTKAHLKKFFSVKDDTNYSLNTSLNGDIEATSLNLFYHDFFRQPLLNKTKTKIRKNFYGCYGVILGIGAGFHIEDLIKKTTINHWVIADLSLDFLQISLSFADWVAIIDIIKERKGSIRFLCHDDHETLASGMLYYIKGRFRGLTHGALFYRHYDFNQLGEVGEAFIKNIRGIFTLTGWCEDEIKHLRHARKNNHIYNEASENRHIFIAKEKKSYTHPALIIGRGPSLYAEQTLLKTLQHKFVIFSCGTSLLPLLQMGVVPDFHVEQENVELVDNVIHDVANDYDISNIILLHTNTTVNLTSYFKRSVLLPREGMQLLIELAHPMQVIPHFAQTCTLTGTVTAILGGFSHVHLLGVDLSYGGYITPPSTKIPKAYPRKDEEWLNYKIFHVTNQHAGDFTKKGNFKPLVKTHSIWNFMHEGFESQSELFKKISVYNHSNGLYITNTKPLPLQNITIEMDNDSDKKDDVEAFFHNFRPANNQLPNNDFFKNQSSSIAKSLPVILKLIDTTWQDTRFSKECFSLKLKDTLEYLMIEDYATHSVIISYIHGSLYRIINSLLIYESWQSTAKDRKNMIKNILTPLKMMIMHSVALYIVRLFSIEERQVYFAKLCKKIPKFSMMMTIVQDIDYFGTSHNEFSIKNYQTYPKAFTKKIIMLEFKRLLNMSPFEQYVNDTKKCDQLWQKWLPFFHHLAQEYASVYYKDHHCKLCKSTNITYHFSLFNNGTDKPLEHDPIGYKCMDCKAESHIINHKNYYQQFYIGHRKYAFNPYKSHYHARHFQQSVDSIQHELKAKDSGLFITNLMKDSVLTHVPDHFDIMIPYIKSINNTSYQILNVYRLQKLPKTYDYMHIHLALDMFYEQCHLLKNLVAILPVKGEVSLLTLTNNQQMIMGDTIPQSSPARIHTTYVRSDYQPIQHHYDSLQYLFHNAGLKLQKQHYYIGDNDKLFLYVKGIKIS